VRRESKGGRARHVSDWDKKGAGCLGELDKDERDCREMEEIRQKIKERKLQKKQEMGRTSASVVATATSSATFEMSKKSDDTVTANRRASKKSSVSHAVSSAADANQGEEAIQWASEAASGTDVAKLGASSKGMTRPKPNKKTATRDVRTVIDASADSLALQEFIVMQYPPVEEVVSSTVRMGRALVSGALGMRTDDPKLFATAVRLPGCTVVLQSTKSKAKVPVYAPPPNSIESDMKINDVEDVQLSQSTTDIGVHIELPDGGIELTPQSVVGGETTVQWGT